MLLVRFPLTQRRTFTCKTLKLIYLQNVSFRENILERYKLATCPSEYSFVHMLRYFAGLECALLS